MSFTLSPPLENAMLPVDVVLGPAWWFHHEGISFDEDYFFHPARRVEVERKMEQVLFDRWGRFGLGADRDKDLPVVGAVHLAAGFLVSEMLGCEVDYLADAAPVVRLADRESLDLSVDDAFDMIRATVTDLVRQSGNPFLTGICCVNMDDKVADEQVDAIFEVAEMLRREYAEQQP